MNIVQTIILTAYLISLAGAASFFLIHYTSLKSDILARVLSNRMKSGRTLRVRWGFRHTLMFIVFSILMSIIPLVNTAFGLGLYKSFTKGMTFQISDRKQYR